MKQKISLPQLRCINAMIHKLNIGPDEKAAIVSGFSQERTASSKELYSDEAILLIRHLKTLDPDEKAAEIMRRKIISRAHEMGWKTPGGKVDMVRIDQWCVKYGYLKKKLNQYTFAELPVLVSIFEEKVYQQFISSL